MKVTSSRQLFWLALLLGCKSTDHGSTVQGLVAAPPHPSWSLSRSAPMENIRYILKPAQPKSPLAKNLAGIQYLRGQVLPGTPEHPGKMGLMSGAIAMTVAGAEEHDNALSIPLYDQQTYAYKLDSAPDLTAPPGDSAYQIVMQDEKHAKIKPGIWNSGKFILDTQTSGGELDMSMEMTEPYHWVRHTNRMPDYDFYTIIDEHGNETPYYHQYLDDIAKSGYSNFKFFTPADSDLGRGGALPTGPQRDKGAPIDSDETPIYNSRDAAAADDGSGSEADTSRHAAHGR